MKPKRLCTTTHSVYISSFSSFPAQSSRKNNPQCYKAAISLTWFIPDDYRLISGVPKQTYRTAVMKIFVFSSLYVILFVLTVFIQLKTEGFTAGGAINISGRKRSEFVVRIDYLFSLSALSVKLYRPFFLSFLEWKEITRSLKEITRLIFVLVIGQKEIEGPLRHISWRLSCQQ